MEAGDILSALASDKPVLEGIYLDSIWSAKVANVDFIIHDRQCSLALKWLIGVKHHQKSIWYLK